METAEIVKIAVSAAPYSIDKPYDYLVPPELLETAVPGVRVTVPLRPGATAPVRALFWPGRKGKKGGAPPLVCLPGGRLVGGEVAPWHCGCGSGASPTLFEAVKAILPAGLWYQIREVWHVAEGMDRRRPPGIRRPPRCWTPCLPPEAPQLSVLEEACGREAGTVLRALQKAGITVCETAARRRIGDKSCRMVELAVSAEEAASLTESDPPPSGGRRCVSWRQRGG